MGEALQGPKQPQTVREWRKAKDSAADGSYEVFKDTLGLIDLALRKFLELHEALGPIDARNPLLLLDFMLLGTHRILLNAAALMAERQLFEGLAVMRPSIEMAAAAAKIGRKPELAAVWLKRGKDDNDPFKDRFPRGDKLTGPLYRTWSLTSDFGAHGNPHLFVLNTDASRKSEANVFYAVQENEQVLRVLIGLLVVASRILDVYVSGLQSLAQDDLKAKKIVLDMAIEVHKHKHKGIFRSIERDLGRTSLDSGD